MCIEENGRAPLRPHTGLDHTSRFAKGGAPPQTRNEQIGKQSTDLVVVDLDEARLAVGIDDDDSLDHASVACRVRQSKAIQMLHENRFNFKKRLTV